MILSESSRTSRGEVSGSRRMQVDEKRADWVTEGMPVRSR